MRLDELERIVAAGESDTVEFKKSTGLLSRAGETLCGFLNGRGGRVFFGIAPDGQIVGQQIADITLQNVAAMISRFEPPAAVEIGRIPLSNGLEVLTLEVKCASEKAPFIFEGKSYQRIGSSTFVMPQERYNELLLARSHDKFRWETASAVETTLNDLDQEAILRVARLGIEKGRLPESTGTNPLDILDRLRLRANGNLLNAAVVLFGKDMVLHFPQCRLKLARFRGVDKSEFLDERQLEGHAFHLLDEAMLFLNRHLPISGRFESGRLERIDELLFPPTALREAIVNAICHRDYSIAGGSISIAVFDDRLEIWSLGKFPLGINAEALKREHESHPRNPTITGVFYRCGLIEQWGRGTQKIIELCKQAGHPEPEFREQAGCVVVTFRPASGSITPQVTTQDNPSLENHLQTISAALGITATQVSTQVSTQVEKLLRAIESGPQSREELQSASGLANRRHFQRFYMEPLITSGWIERTIPDKPNSRLQKYHLTEKGRAWLSKHPSENQGSGGQS